VAHVFLEEDPYEGKTAVVVVPDDQLSLAIGREGQNARLAAKLTGWRIDIKSLTEAASDAIDNLDHPDANEAATKDKELIEAVQLIIEKKAANRPITSEDYRTLDKIVNGVMGAIIAARSIRHEEIRKERTEARKQVPTGMWQVPLEELDLPGRIHNLLLDNEVETVGDVKFNLTLGDDVILNFRGLGDAALDTIKEHLADFEVKFAEQMAVEAAEAEAEEATEVEEAEAEAAVEIEEAEEAVEAEAEAMESEVAEEVVEAEEIEEAVDEDEPELEAVDIIDDLSQSLVQETPKPAKKQKKKGVVIARPTAAEQRAAEEEAEKKRKGTHRELVYDEDMGEVVAKRKRKGSRRKQEWDDFDLDDF
jgi:N utilization substance protein A